jgi:hypothetical protein
MTAKVEAKGPKNKVPLGNKGNEKRIIPYVPNLSNKTANNTEPIVGAST